jgi:hypothetical protein
MNTLENFRSPPPHRRKSLPESYPKDLEASPSDLTVRFETVKYDLPLSLVLPLSPEYLPSYLSQNPTNPTTAAVFRVSKGFLVVGFRI